MFWRGRCLDVQHFLRRGEEAGQAPSDQQQISGLRRTLGPPWSSEEKLASIAAWIALEFHGTELRQSKTRLAV